MAKSTKQAVEPALTETQFNHALSENLKAHNREAKLLAQMNEQLERVRAKFATDLERLRHTKEETFSTAQRYCEANEGALFPQKRSRETAFGVVGFKKNPASVVLREGKSWDEVVADLKKRLPDYVRTKEEADKAAILRDREDAKVSARLESLGISFQQGEQFYFKPKAA